MDKLKVSLNKVVRIYNKNGVKVRNALMDGQFEVMRMALAELKIDLNLCAANEHILEVERAIMTLKERVRATFNSLPYKKLPAMMVIEMV